MNSENPSIVVIGTGFAGLCMAIALKRAGIDDFIVYEKDDEVGGTWRDNHYPGAGCDVPSHLYSYSFEPNPRWSRAFAPQREILDYLRHCADKYGIRKHIRFRTAVTGLTFDDDTSLWTVSTSDGLTRRVPVVVSGMGGLGKAHLPEIAGLEAFRGKLFHSTGWDHTFPLEGMRAGVIGTGASAIQIIPSIAPRVKALDVYQRTPAWVFPKPDRHLSSAEKALFKAIPATQLAVRAAQYWTHEFRALAFMMEKTLLPIGERQGLDYLKEQVADPILREKLTPKYRLGCKRILLSNEYYAALQRPNVSLVTDPIERVVEDGVVTRGGVHHPLDVLVCATGFEAAKAKTPFPVIGRGGVHLDDRWKDGQEAYLGTVVSGFPNLFALIGPNTGVGHNSTVLMIEAQANYICQGIAAMRREGICEVDVRARVERDYNDRLRTRLDKAIWSSGCKSWYLDKNGRNTALYPGFSFEFSYVTRTFRLSDYVVRRAPVRSPVRASAAPAASCPMHEGKGFTLEPVISPLDAACPIAK